jgi:penicillin-binding protein 1A
MAYNKRHGYHGPEATVENVAQLSEAQLDELLSERPNVPELAPGIVTRADASSADVYIGDGQTETLRLWQVKWARRYKNENWRGPQPRRVTDAVAAGDVIRLRRDDQRRPDPGAGADRGWCAGGLVAAGRRHPLVVRRLRV